MCTKECHTVMNRPNSFWGQFWGQIFETDSRTLQSKRVLHSFMQDAGAQTCFLIQIGNQRDEPELYLPMQQAQEELASEQGDIVLVSRQFKTFAAKGLMKDRFHYLQPAYNAVGTEAGRNAAAYWNR